MLQPTVTVSRRKFSESRKKFPSQRLARFFTATA